MAKTLWLRANTFSPSLPHLLSFSTFSAILLHQTSDLPSLVPHWLPPEASSGHPTPFYFPTPSSATPPSWVELHQCQPPCPILHTPHSLEASRPCIPMQQWWGAVTTRRLIQLCQKSRIRSDCTISRQPPLSHYNCFQYNTSYSIGFTYIFKLLHMCLNFEHKINRNKNICNKIENDRIDW